MEAKGHEFIEKNLSEFLEKIVIAHANKPLNLKGCKQIVQMHYNRTFTDNIGKAMYLGNWLTDNSQLFAPDFFFDFKYNLPSNLQSAQDTCLTIQQKMHTMLQGLLTDELITDILKPIDKFLNSTIIHIKELKQKTTKDKPNPNKFEYAIKDEWWLVAQSIIKLLGYKKFCMAENKKLSNETFTTIVSSFIDQNTEIKSGYHFKLNQYYPNDHLDRNFDPTHLKAERGRQYFADRWLKLQKPSTQTNKEYEDKCSLRRNCFDERNISSSQYGYLQDYIEILGQKFNYLNKELITPYFIQGIKSAQDPHFLTLCAQLGHSLHGVEDFFAHSNYLELVVKHLDKLQGQMNSPAKYFNSNEFVSLLEENGGYEKTRYDKAKIKAIRDFNSPKATTIEEEILTTGIFAEVDTFTSLYHLTFGIIEEKLEDIAKNGNVTDDPFISIIQYLIESIGDYINLVENYPADLDDRIKIAKGFKKKFDIDIVKFILNLNPSFKKEKTPLDDELLNYIVDLLNHIIKAVEPLLIASKNIIMVLKFVQVMLTIIFLPFIILLFIKQLVLNTTGRIPLLVLLNVAKNEMGNYIEKDKLNLNNKKMYGTHSIIAKDESYRNEVMNRQAKRMALFMDEFILLNMFIGTDVDKKEQIDMVAMLHKYLKHPCPDNSKSREEIEKELAIYGTNGIVNVIDKVTHKVAKYPLKYILQKGLNNKIKTESAISFKNKFLELNGEFIKSEFLGISNFNLDDIPVPPNKDFNTIVLPYQKSELTISFFNNQYSPAIQIKDVVVTAQAPINPNKMWMMQFFNKADYELLTEYGLWDSFLEYLNLKKEEDRLDDIFPEKDRVLFGNDKEAVLQIANTSKMSFKDVAKKFEKEIEKKKEYESFVQEFIKIHYK